MKKILEGLQILGWGFGVYKNLTYEMVKIIEGIFIELAED
jgi:hypothetical protein